MQLQQPKKNSLSLYVKFGALVFLLSLSILVVACSSNSSVQLNQGTPVATVTINLNQSGGSPTPPLKDYYCGGWATNTTPAFSPNTIVSVYGKFTHNVNGNPEGVPGATATAMVLWPDGSTDNVTATTSSDGLAVFPIALSNLLHAYPGLASTRQHSHAIIDKCGESLGHTHRIVWWGRSSNGYTSSAVGNHKARSLRPGSAWRPMLPQIKHGRHLSLLLILKGAL